jgi:hypothetical protein
MSSPDPQASARRIAFRAALLLAPLVGLALATPWLLRTLRPAGPPPPPLHDRPPTEEQLSEARRAERRLADARKGWEGSTVIAGKDAVQDATGERVRWFQGFGLSVETRPGGASVVVDGKELGVTPLTASVACRPGAPVVVELRRGSGTLVRRTTRCRRDQLVELTVDLR